MKRWDRAEENFIPDDKMDNDETERYVRGVRHYDFDQFLGPYPAEACAKWKFLAHYITPTLLGRLEPITKVIESQSAIEEQRVREKEMKEARAQDLAAQSTNS